jgi:hypothetical protein
MAEAPADSAPTVLIGKPAPPVVFRTAHCLVGSYKDTQGECADRGGQAHHIIPDEYMRQVGQNRVAAHAAAAAATAGGTPDTSRVDDSFPSIEDGCCICVGGNAYGSTAQESDPQSAEGKANKAAILEKGAKYAQASGGPDMTTRRGHGFLHQIDERFRELEPTVDNALKTANDLLDELTVYENPPDPECVKEAKKCIEKQMAPAKLKDAKLNKKTPRSAESKARRREKLRLP